MDKNNFTVFDKTKELKSKQINDIRIQPNKEESKSLILNLTINIFFEKHNSITKTIISASKVVIAAPSIPNCGIRKKFNIILTSAAVIVEYINSFSFLFGIIIE